MESALLFLSVALRASALLRSALLCCCSAELNNRAFLPCDFSAAQLLRPIRVSRNESSERSEEREGQESASAGSSGRQLRVDLVQKGNVC